MTSHSRIALMVPLLLAANLLVAQAPSSAEWHSPAVDAAALWPERTASSGTHSADLEIRLRDPLRGGLLQAGTFGVAPLMGPVEEERFLVRIAIDFLDGDTAVRVRVLDTDGSELNFVDLSSAEPGRWEGDLCDVIPSQGARVEMKVLRGRALGTVLRIGREYVTSVPILGTEARKASLGGTIAIARSICLDPQAEINPLSVGTSKYTRNLSWPGTSFSYVVQGGPPNTCGDIHTYRNGNWHAATGWLCTDGTGYGTKGPWYVTTSYPGADQTDAESYIRWPNTMTTTSTSSIIDVTPPTVTITPNTTFFGSASDGPWGIGFSREWTRVELRYRDDTTGSFWNSKDPCYSFPSCYTLGYAPPDIALTDLPQTGTAKTFNWGYQPYVGCPQNHSCSVVVTVFDRWSSTTATRRWSSTTTTYRGD